MNNLTHPWPPFSCLLVFFKVAMAFLHGHRNTAQHPQRHTIMEVQLGLTHTHCCFSFEGKEFGTLDMGTVVDGARVWLSTAAMTLKQTRDEYTPKTPHYFYLGRCTRSICCQSAEPQYCSLALTCHWARSGRRSLHDCGHDWKPLAGASRRRRFDKTLQILGCGL